MAWRDRYLPASFRGVRFHVRAHENTGGRRLQTHQYPGSDEPFTEDLGRRAREFSVEAYIVGDDYMERRDALLDACEKGGPGTLIHPYRGQREVACDRYRLSESTAEGRMCRITLELVEAGRNRHPTDRANSRAVLSEAAGAAHRAAVDDLDRWVRGSPSTGTGIFVGIALVLLALGGMWKFGRMFGTGGRVLTTRRRRGWTKLDRVTLEDAIERQLEAIDRRNDVHVRINRRGRVNVRLVTPDPSTIGPIQEIRDAIDEQCTSRALPCRSGRITATTPRRMTRRRQVR